ncbi:MAG: small multi-drug export protein [Oscillospiraceae bacterium]|nr:small multi-drug export protein [Oscillospiraceae bacterium]
MKELIYVFLISMLPVVELRGAVPIGAGLGLSPAENIIAAVAGNMLPVPFVVIFVRRVIAWLSSKNVRLKRVIDRYLSKRIDRHAKIKYTSELVALAVFVAIPLPGTGAWTGAVIAGMLGLRLKTAVPAIAIGVVAAGIIVSILTYGVKAVIT